MCPGPDLMTGNLSCYKHNLPSSFICLQDVNPGKPYYLLRPGPDTYHVQALIRLQDVYELDISRLAEGKIGPRDTAAKLSAQVNLSNILRLFLYQLLYFKLM